jgi:hypothetical protein
MTVQEAHKKYLETINNRQWILDNVHEDDQEDALQTLGSNGYDLESYKSILLLNDEFNQEWSFGCTADLTVDERMNLLNRTDWTFETDEDVHLIADNNKIPRRKFID